MKKQSFTITEHHPPRAAPPERAIRQAVVAWLARALRPGRPGEV